MSGWKDMRLGDAAKVNPPEKIARGGAAPFIDMASVAADCGGVQRVTSKVFTGGGARFRAGDTLVARITPCLENGKIAVVPPLEADVGFGSTEFVVLRGDGVTTFSPFVRYLAMTSGFREHAEQNLIGSSGRQRVSADLIAQYRVSLPPLEEQERIAGVLGAFDDLIETNQRTSRRIEDLIHALFAEGHFDDAPGAEHTATLGAVLEVNPKVAKPKGTAPYVDMAMLPTSSALLGLPAERIAAGGARFQNGDTLLARITPCLENGKTAYVTNLQDEATAVGSTEFIVLRRRSEMPAIWPYCLARSPRFRAFAIQQLGDGTSGRQRVSADAVANYVLPRPSPAALSRFGNRTDRLVEVMIDLHAEAQELVRQRDELLPLLMSGTVRVRDLEAVA